MKYLLCNLCIFLWFNVLNAQNLTFNELLDRTHYIDLETFSKFAEKKDFKNHKTRKSGKDSLLYHVFYSTQPSVKTSTNPIFNLLLFQTILSGLEVQILIGFETPDRSYYNLLQGQLNTVAQTIVKSAGDTMKQVRLKGVDTNVVVNTFISQVKNSAGTSSSYKIIITRKINARDVKDFPEETFMRIKQGSNIFFGQLTKGEPTLGMKVLNDKSIFRGMISEKLNYRWGLLIKADGQAQFGEFSKDFKHDFGYTSNTNMDVYDGPYKNGEYDGLGILIGSEGDIYYGDFKKGLKNGKGIYYYKNGDVYYGDFFNNKISGRGFTILTNGTSVWSSYDSGATEGNMILNYPDGTSKKLGKDANSSRPDTTLGPYKLYELNDGVTFLGRMNKGQKWGMGVLNLKNGEKFYGRFVYGVKDGFGIFIDTAGNVSFVRNNLGKPEEIDFKVFKNGDMRDYRGLVRLANGDFFRDSSAVKISSNISLEKGTYFFYEGDMYNGTFQNKQMNGAGKYFDFVKFEFFKGYFKNNLREGKGKIYSLNGLSKEVIYRNGVIVQ